MQSTLKYPARSPTLYVSFCTATSYAATPDPAISKRAISSRSALPCGSNWVMRTTSALNSVSVRPLLSGFERRKIATNLRQSALIQFAPRINLIARLAVSQPVHDFNPVLGVNARVVLPLRKEGVARNHVRGLPHLLDLALHLHALANFHALVLQPGAGRVLPLTG